MEITKKLNIPASFFYDKVMDYKFRTSTTKNEFVVHYQIKPVDDSTCEVHYTEKMESYGMLQKLNDMLLGTILMYFKRRRFKKMLEMIEATY